MTDYSPLHDALESNDNRAVTATDMVEEGYDDFDSPNDLQDVQASLALALDALDGQIFGDPAKWMAVNQLVAAIQGIDEHAGTTTEFDLDERGLTVRARSP